jgi:hypothetical protein
MVQRRAGRPVAQAPGQHGAEFERPRAPQALEQGGVAFREAVGQAFGKEGYVIRNMANATVEENEGFTVDNTPWMSPEERRKTKQSKE